MKRLQLFAASLLVISAFFWAWALKNTIERTEPPNVDLGVVSFATVMVTSTYLLALSHVGSTPSRLVAIITAASHGLVSLNYLGGVYAGFAMLDRPEFSIYCIIFSILWAGIAVFGYRLLVRKEENDKGPREQQETLKNPKV